jgi:hypothetical protein
MMINRIYEHQNLLSLYLVSFLVGLRTYQQPCTAERCIICADEEMALRTDAYIKHSVLC